MSLFTDILAGLPENAVLRTKIRDAEARYAALETENAILKDDLREANTKIKDLESRLEDLTAKGDLSEIELDLLERVGKIDHEHAAAQVIQINFFQEVSLERIKYHLTRLEDFGYIHGGIISRLGTLYAVTQKGREVLLNHNRI